MARRKQFKDIASGIGNLFNSRNNDLAGHWAIGKLCRFSLEQNTVRVRLDILNIHCTPASTEFDAVMHDHKLRLHALMDRQCIPVHWLKAATIEIDFQPVYEMHLHYFRSFLGSPYTVTVALLTDLGKLFSVRTGGNCNPHNPVKESRRRA